MNIQFVYDFCIADNTIFIDEMEIIPLFDGPHLFKCIRNNMLTKLLEFDVGCSITNQRRFANWAHIKLAYEIDINNLNNNRQLPNLTQNHFSDDNRKKMRVKYAAQALSNSVAKAIHDFIRRGNFIIICYYI